MEPAIVVRDLTKRYGNKVAIRALNFEIQAGYIVGFLGPNGAGKSTTLRILSGLMPASSGSIYINGLSMTRQPQQVKRYLGYMPEDNPLPEDMRVEEYLRFRAQLKQIPRKLVQSNVDKVLERCDLHRTAAKKMIGTLSKGFRQRVGIAEALLSSPKIIILDEPMIGLDPHQILGMRDLLKQLKGEVTVLYSSHILSEVEVACTHLMILNKGQLVANDTPENLRKQYFKATRYELTLADKNEDFQNSLSKAPFPIKLIKNFSFENQGTTYILETESQAEAIEPQLTRWIFEKGWPLIQFTKIAPNLESLFLKLTSADWKKVNGEQAL